VTWAEYVIYFLPHSGSWFLSVPAFTGFSGGVR
jgi:hypothetical protein